MNLNLMNFEQAVYFLNNGQTIARKAWDNNRKLKLSFSNTFVKIISKLLLLFIGKVSSAMRLKNDKNDYGSYDFLDLTHEDILAEDWYVVEFDEEIDKYLA